MKASPLLAVALALAACEAPAPPRPSGQWTLFDLDRALLGNQQVLVGAEGYPAGMPAKYFLGRATNGAAVVPISSAFTEGKPSPYLTTNVWANFPEVWVQPMYILVTHIDDATGRWVVLPQSKWIFTVGPQSRFHSPFWQVYWAIVPMNTSADKYTSSEQLFADHIELRPGPGHLVSLAPDQTTVEAVADSKFGKVNHLTGELPTPRVRQHWLDGALVTALEFGENRFEWNDEREVLEQPFFVLAGKAADGEYQPTRVPNVGGTGPLFERRPAIAPRNRPIFGSYWRLYLVKLPPTKDAAVFLPKSLADRRIQVEDWVDLIEVPPVDWDPSTPEVATTVNARALQVALNGRECFTNEASFKTCRWLDSQQAIEEALPSSIVRTGITVTCPFVSYGGNPVPLQ